jgi:hypothetical protein
MSSEPEKPGKLEPLGSLAQSARLKRLKQARWILIVIGILTIVANGVFIAIQRDQVKREIDKELQTAGPGAVVDRAKVREVEEAALRRQSELALGWTTRV